MSTLIYADKLDDSLKIASGYSQSAKILMKYIGQTRSPQVVHSMVVLRSLALDIYLRSLYALDRDKAYEGHHVKQVFDALGEETRRKVRECYDRNVGDSEFIKQTHAKHQEMKGTAANLNLENVLQEWSDAMAEGKHFFALQHKVAFLAFGEVEKALLERIKELADMRAASSAAEPKLAA